MSLSSGDTSNVKIAPPSLAETCADNQTYEWAVRRELSAQIARLASGLCGESGLCGSFTRRFRLKGIGSHIMKMIIITGDKRPQSLDKMTNT